MATTVRGTPAAIALVALALTILHGSSTESVVPNALVQAQGVSGSIIWPRLGKPSHAASQASRDGSQPTSQPPRKRVPTRDPNQGRIGRSDNIDCSAGVSATLQASATEVVPEAPVILTWSITRESGCTQVRVLLDGQAASSRGRQTVHPITPTVYALTMRQDNQVLTLAKVEVKVVPGRVVHIKGNTPEWAHLLITALARPHTTVRLAEHVDMDLSMYDSISLAEGVNLTSEQAQDPGINPRLAARAAAARGTRDVISRITAVRSGTRLGPRLYTTNRPARWFRLYCEPDGKGGSTGANNVRLNGFRLIGPHFDSMEGDDNVEKGIYIISCKNIEISNMELAGWSGAAIYVIDDYNLNADVNEVRIFNNHFHNNQHQGGNGYGVDVMHGAAVSIFHNVFDFNRHAIAASGHDGVKYRAHENLVLKGGGLHDRAWNTYTHQFDVHGDGCWWSDNLCGNAGQEFWFTNNAFQYINDHAIKIRGRPRKMATISFNVFPHEGLENDWGRDAINVPSLEHVDIRPGNVINYDSYGQYGVCDFDADGKDDLFLPTGVTWWFSSAAKMHWVFLKSATARLNDVGFGYFDGDAKCDVVAKNGDRLEVSSGGTDEWVPFGGSYPFPFDQLRFADFNADGVTDVFRRDEDGQWSIISPGHHDWRPVQNSSYSLSQLRFGDFDGDNITDVLRRSGNGLMYSKNATEGWQPLNPNLAGDLSKLFIGDVDNNGIDDIVRYDVQGGAFVGQGTWQISRDGRSNWQTLGSVQFPPRPPGGAPVDLRTFSGRFDDKPGVDLLHIDYSRMSQVTGSSGTAARHGLYAY